MIAKLCGMIIGVQSCAVAAIKTTRACRESATATVTFLSLDCAQLIPPTHCPTPPTPRPTIVTANQSRANKDSEEGTLSSSSRVCTTHALPILAYHDPSPTCRPRSISNSVAVCGLIRLFRCTTPPERHDRAFCVYLRFCFSPGRWLLTSTPTTCATSLFFF